MHRIRRTRWSVRAGSEEQALAIRHWLREHQGAELQEAMAAAFDGAAPEDEVVRLGRLEIALAVRGVAEIPDTLSVALGGELGRRLRGEARREVWGGSAHQRRAPSLGPALLQYLLTGNLVWPMGPDDPAALPSLAEAARHDPAAIAAEVAGCAPDPTIRRHAMVRLGQLLEVPGPRASLDSGRSAPPPRRLEWLTERTSARKADHLGEGSPAAIKDGSGEFTSPPQDQPVPLARAPRPRRSDGSPPGAAEAVTQPVEDGPAERAPLSVALPMGEGAPTDFPLAVAHAGLVLVHPFLPQLVQAVGLGSPRAWDPSSDATARIAALLHFLATGREVPYELELGFIKILLGLRPDTAMPLGAGLLEESDRREAEALLHAVVAHWPALKRTSIEALRASFLQRAGLVLSDENGWRLAIEPGPFDVLLRRLPWSFSVVKLPWTSMLVHCSWTTS